MASTCKPSSASLPGAAPEPSGASDPAREIETPEVLAASRRRIAAAEIGLTPDEESAAALCGEWHGEGFSGFCRGSILALVESTFAEMESLATRAGRSRNSGRQERHRAARFHKEAAPIMARLGWDGITLDPSLTLISDIESLP